MYAFEVYHLCILLWDHRNCMTGGFHCLTLLTGSPALLFSRPQALTLKKTHRNTQILVCSTILFTKINTKMVFNVSIMIRIFTFKVFFFAIGFFVLGLQGTFCWIKDNMIDVCAEMMPILLHSHFHQAGTWRENRTQCMDACRKEPDSEEQLSCTLNFTSFSFPQRMLS